MTKRTRAIRKQKNKIRKQKNKKAWGVILRKYDLEDDLDKTWELGVREVADIPWITPKDIILFDFTGTLAEYRHIYRQEKASEKASEAAP